MGVMLANVQDERVQEAISEPFRVMDNRVKGTLFYLFFIL
jgi:hypothetical protein